MARNRNTMQKQPCCVYLIRRTSMEGIVQSGQGSRAFYVGMAKDAIIRLSQHNAGEVLATRGADWELVCYIPCPDRNTASILERWLKVGDSRDKRDAMICARLPENRCREQDTNELIRKARIWWATRAVKAHMYADLPASPGNAGGGIVDNATE